MNSLDDDFAIDQQHISIVKINYYCCFFFRFFGIALLDKGSRWIGTSACVFYEPNKCYKYAQYAIFGAISVFDLLPNVKCILYSINI